MDDWSTLGDVAAEDNVAAEDDRAAEGNEASENERASEDCRAAEDDEASEGGRAAEDCRAAEDGWSTLGESRRSIIGVRDVDGVLSAWVAICRASSSSSRVLRVRPWQ